MEMHKLEENHVFRRALNDENQLFGRSDSRTGSHSRASLNVETCFTAEGETKKTKEKACGQLAGRRTAGKNVIVEPLSTVSPKIRGCSEFKLLYNPGKN